MRQHRLATLELATVGRLAAMPGVESQLNSHIRISLNVGLSLEQLREVTQVLAQSGQPDAAQHGHEALARVLTDAAKQ